MSSNRLTRLATVVAGCLGATAFAGLPWADASSSHAAAAMASKAGRLCVRYDSDDPQAKCLRSGPRGRAGLQGLRGAVGPRGLTGPVGLTGAVGAVGLIGPTGPQGIQGIQGIQGVQGPSGAFAADGADPGDSTKVVLGGKLGPITFPTGPGTGTELTPTVARCPTYGADREAYDGGAIVTTANPSLPGQPTNDVVGLESSYPGLYVSQTEVDPLPIGGQAGSVSNQAANAYEAQAVITHMDSGDNLTVQSYVVCGP